MVPKDITCSATDVIATNLVGDLKWKTICSDNLGDDNDDDNDHDGGGSGNDNDDCHDNEDSDNGGGDDYG